MKEPRHKQKQQIDWAIDEDDEQWQALPAPAQSNQRGVVSGVQRKEVALASTLALVLLLFLGGWFVLRPTQSTPDTPFPSATLVKAPAPVTMIAQMPVTPLPSALDFGTERILMIAHFTIRYHAVDADAVYETAPKLEQLYATLRHDFGLPMADAGAAYTIEVATAGVQSVNNVNFLLHRVSVTSPALLLLASSPKMALAQDREILQGQELSQSQENSQSQVITQRVEFTPATLLYQELVYPLTRLLEREAIHQHDRAWQQRFAGWNGFEEGLALWEVWTDGGPLAAHHQQVSEWLVHNGQADVAQGSLPAGYDRLCHIYRIWQIIPLDLSIPLTCSEADNSPSSLPSLAPLEMLHLRPSRSYGQERNLEKSGYSPALTSEAFIDYIVAHYGRDKLPQLVEALGRHDSLETLLPALVGLSPAQFETQWQAYLAATY